MKQLIVCTLTHRQQIVKGFFALKVSPTITDWPQISKLDKLAIE